MFEDGAYAHDFLKEKLAFTGRSEILAAI